MWIFVSQCRILLFKFPKFSVVLAWRSCGDVPLPKTLFAPSGPHMARYELYCSAWSTLFTPKLGHDWFSLVLTWTQECDLKGIFPSQASGICPTTDQCTFLHSDIRPNAPPNCFEVQIAASCTYVNSEHCIIQKSINAWANSRLRFIRCPAVNDCAYESCNSSHHDPKLSLTKLSRDSMWNWLSIYIYRLRVNRPTWLQRRNTINEETSQTF